MTEEPPTPADALQEVEVGGAGAGHAEAEGVEAPAEGGRSMIYRAARSTEPNPPLDQVGGFDDVRDHWQQYGMRGLQKAANVDDSEAWVDLLKFAIGMTLENYSNEGETEDAPEAEETERISMALNE